MTSPPGLPPPERGCQLPRAPLRQGQPRRGPVGPRSPRGAPLGPNLPGAREGGRSGDGAAAPGPGPSLPARPARRGRVPPAGGAGAGLALPIGAGEPGTLPPPRPRSAPRTHPGGRRDAQPAPRSLAASPRRAGSLAARPGRDRRKTRSSSAGTNLRRAREKGQRTRGRQGWWRLAPRAPAPTARGMARGSALLLLCAPAVWVAAALLLCLPRTSGRIRRPGASPWCRAEESRALGSAPPRLCPQPLSRAGGAAQGPSPLVPRASAPRPSPRAPHRSGCFQRGALWGRLSVSRGRAGGAGAGREAPGRGSARVVSVKAAWSRVRRCVFSSQDLGSVLALPGSPCRAHGPRTPLSPRAPHPGPAPRSGGAQGKGFPAPAPRR